MNVKLKPTVSKSASQQVSKSASQSTSDFGSKNYLPWVLGGAGLVCLVGVLIYFLAKKNKETSVKGGFPKTDNK